jgi:hypothetical protein
MIPITRDVIDCTGFEIITSLPWGPDEGRGDDQKDGHGPRQRTGWGFVVCKPSASSRSVAAPDMKEFYGVVSGSLQSDCIETPCVGISLQSASDPQRALSHFMLACGLSVIEKAKVELGDMVVVAGANPLTLSVLVAANQQGARTACVIPETIGDATYRLAVEQVAEVSIMFTFHPSYDAKLDTLVETSRGKVVYVDTAGTPNLVYSMASRLRTFGALILCRQDSAALVQMDILRDIHRKSAQIIFWTRPEDLEGGLALSKCCLRAARLFQWKQVTLHPSGLHEV